VSMSHVDDGMLHAYLDGELAPVDARGVDAHVAQCPDCRRRLDEERALIARAAELLALATPPDRQVPPFRAGDVKAPARVWWRVRLPLAWAATVALALGIGSYLGREATPARQAELATDRAAARARSLARREFRPEARGTVRTPPAAASAPAAVSPAPGLARVDNIARPRPEPVESKAEGKRPRELAAKIAVRKAASDERDAWQKGDVISLDSARHVLRGDPLVVPGVPVEAFYVGRGVGYSAVVIVQQALDSTTMIEVINARAAPLRLDQVVVAGAPAPTAVADSASAAERSLAYRALAADSLEAFPKGAAPRPVRAAVQPSPNLFRDVRGPLSPDSLAALRRRLQPLGPAIGP